MLITDPPGAYVHISDTWQKENHAVTLVIVAVSTELTQEMVFQKFP